MPSLANGDHTDVLSPVRSLREGWWRCADDGKHSRRAEREIPAGAGDGKVVGAVGHDAIDCHGQGRGARSS